MRRSHEHGVALAAALLFGFSASGSAVAQQVTPLAAGQAVTGSIVAEDSRLAEGHGYDVYSFEGTAGQTVVATMRSSVFDTYLVLARNTGVITEELVTDDDGAGGTDSRVAYTLPADGTYLLLARGLSPEAAGDYILDLGTIARAAPTIVPISAGETRVGNLAPGDDFTSDLKYYEVFTFEGSAGDRYSVSMRSSQFDAYLDVGHWDGEALSSLATNDDGFDSSTDSRVTFTLPGDGMYAARATSLRPQATGSFSVGLEAVAPVTDAGSTPIRAGETLTGALAPSDGLLDDGSHFDLYAFSGTPGQSVTITMRSGDFDTFLTVGDPAGAADFGELASDDDGAGGTDSEVTAQVPVGGTLLIRANSLSAGRTGAYTISVAGEAM